MKWREEVDRGEHSLMTDPECAAQNDDVRHAWSRPVPKLGPFEIGHKSAA